MTLIDIWTCQSNYDINDQLTWNIHLTTPAQCRAARGLLDWSQQALAERAAVGIVTIRQLEAGSHEPRRATLFVVRQAFEAAGVEFIDENGGGPGVRLRKPVKGKSGK
jgi:transcriptional regulator with XRE-family HTH domain